MYVGTRRIGVGTFLVHFFGYKKNYKVEIKLLVCYSERRGRDWLLRSRLSLRLTPFPSARRRGPCKPTAQKAASRHLLFPHLRLQVNLRQRYKNKRYRFLDTFLLRGLAEREGLATTLPMVAPLNAFPFCSPQGPLQAHCAKSSKPTSFVSTPSSASKLAPKV